MKRTAVITKTFAPDFKLCAALNRSVLKKFPETIDDRIIAPQSDLEFLSRFAGPGTLIRCETDFLPSTFVRAPFSNTVANVGRKPVGGRTRQHRTRCYCAILSEAIHLLHRACRILLIGAALLLQAPLPSRAAEPSTDSTWSHGLTSGVNGPIPLIVVDQFGYPTKAAKIAVIRNPQVGYDSVVHFTPGKNYAVVDRTTRAIIKRGTPTAWNDGATDNGRGPWSRSSATIVISNPCCGPHYKNTNCAAARAANLR